MKISDIVNVNITENLTYSSNVEMMNNTAAILFVHTADEETSDTSWISSGDLDSSYTGKDEVDKALTTYFANGGVGMVVWRIYFAETDGPSAQEKIDEITAAIAELDSGIKNVQIVWETKDADISYSTLAGILEDTTHPEDSKILFVTSNVGPTSLTTLPNIFWHYTGSLTHYYESAAAMAYVSKINYEDNTIKDYEYTPWYGSSTEVNLVSSLPAGTQDGGYVNYFSTVAGFNVLINGLMTNGTKFITYYFELVLSNRIMDVLTKLTLSKLNFEQTTYAYLYNVLTIELDIFAQNGLLNNEFVVQEDMTVYRDNVRYSLAEAGEVLTNGYIVKTLPPTADDLSSRNYTGIYILFAVANQIRTIDVSAIVLGGIS